MSIIFNNNSDSDDETDQIYDNFIKLCDKGNIEEIKIFYGEHSEIINNDKSSVFYHMCEHNQLEIAKWFYELYPEISNNILDEMFIMLACPQGFIEMAQWLYSIHTNMDDQAKYSGFIEACQKGHLLIAQWIYSNGFGSYMRVSFEDICSICIRNEYIEMVEWLCTLQSEMDWLKDEYYAFQDYSFQVCVIYGKLKSAQWLLNKYPKIKEYKQLWIVQNINKICLNGHFQMVQWLYSNFVISYIINIDEFIQLCKKNYLEMVQWFYSLKHIELPYDKHEELFNDVSKSGYFEMAKWLYTLKPIIELSPAFIETCKNGNLEIAQWIYQINNKIDFSWHVEINSESEDGDENENERTNFFIIACENGHLDICIWLYSIYLNEINISEYNEYLFRNACEKGYLEMAKWLLSVKPDINISTMDENAFQKACENNHLEIAKWLISIKPDIDICAINNYAMISACDHGYLEVAKWLLSIKPDMDLRVENDLLFGVVCREGQVKVAKWLLSICPEIDICAENDYAFKKACENNHPKMVKWLVSLKPYRYSYKIDEDSEDSEDKFTITFKIREDPVSKEMEESEIIDCSICLSTKSEIITGCNHQFCKNCVNNWVIIKNICPYCRSDLFYENIFTIKHK